MTKRELLFVARPVVGFLLVATLASCTPGQAMLSRRAHTAREDLVGLTQDEVLACAGRPLRAQHSGSWEYWSYSSGPPQIGSNHTTCITTFTFQRGYVSSVDYENKNGGLIGQSIPECLNTVGPCLPAEL
jgi:hypothetical protein